LSFVIVSVGLLADFLIWKQLPGMWGFLGIFSIVLGGTLAIYFGQKEISTR
jgi:membrane-bound metal-dependent hydrolase YbcI (DUF457 family)